MKFIRIILYLIVPFYLFSCSTQQRLRTYLQEVNDSTGKGEVRIPELRIQKNDQLHIQVYSASTKPEISDAPYNLPTFGQQAGNQSGGAGALIRGFLVDVNGNIEYPQIGTIQAEGLTRLELAEVIKGKINEKDTVLTNPQVIVRFINLKVTVLGEVNQQGPISMPGERVTILEAIGLAGGTTDYAIRNSVKVMREIDGKRELGFIDLSSDSLFASPYYNLQQNDVVIVDPFKRKIKRLEQADVMRQIGYGVTLISAIALLYNIFN